MPTACILIEMPAVEFQLLTSPSFCHYSAFPPSSLGSGSQFIRTKLFNELEKYFRRYQAGTSCTLLCLLGPRGLGKTTAMVQLMRDRSNGSDVFIDLGALSPTEVITVEPKCSTSMLNCMIEQLLHLGHCARLLWLHSPGTRCKDALHVLIKACGDGQDASFFFRPFAYEEALKLPSMFGFQIGNSNSFEGKVITQRQFNWLFCVTNGIPRYIKWYLSLIQRECYVHCQDNMTKQKLKSRGRMLYQMN